MDQFVDKRFLVHKANLSHGKISTGYLIQVMNYMSYFLNVSENTYKLQIPYASKLFKKNTH